MAGGESMFYLGDASKSHSEFSEYCMLCVDMTSVGDWNLHWITLETVHQCIRNFVME